MGNKVSTTTTDHHQDDSRGGDDECCKNLFDLNDDELLQLLNKNPLNFDDVHQMAMNLSAKKDGNNNNEIIKEDGQQQQSNNSTTNDNWYYVNNSNSQEVILASRLNTISSSLAKLRFRMVPARLKEAMFWASVFALLENRLQEEEIHRNIDDDNNSYQNNDEKLATRTIEEVEENSKQKPNNNNISLLLASKDRRIASLRQQVEELQKEIKALKEEKAIAAIANNDHSTANTTVTTQPQHAGKWILDKDSKEFLEFPDEIKDNMRKEKQRRIKQVQSEMSFILDSDNLEDTHGHWECCGNTIYLTTTCKVVK